MVDILSEFEQGADLTIMNTFYQRPTADEEGKKIDDFLAIIYKDNKTGVKHHKIINKPNYTFYMTKDDETLDYSRMFIEKDKVYEVTVPYNDILKKIAKETGNMSFYNDNIATRNSMENRRLHALPNVFHSDTDIEDYYRFLFAKKFTNNIAKIDKAYFDIEVDTRYITGDFVEMGEAPINAIAYLDEKSNMIYSFLLRDKRNPLIAEFENDITSGKITHDDIKEFIKVNIGGWKSNIRYGMDNTTVNISFFDIEIELVRTFFNLVHIMQPDFIGGWNSSSFDLEYIIERIKVLGHEPAEVMCDPTWEIGIVRNIVDQRHLNEICERGDFAVISGNTVWIDMMIQYGSRRKSKIGSIKSLKLDDIAHDVAGVRKLDYSHITSNIAMLPWLDYKTFVLYNIFDVICLKCIETKTQDLDYMFTKCLINNTSYKKCHRQTVYLINRMAKEFDKLGYVIGNNTNKWNEKPDKFLGALVGNPVRTADYSKIKVNGIPIWVCDNLQDFDYKSLYPNIALENNIAPNTQIGRIEIPNKVYENENSNMNDKYSRGGEFIENMVTDNIIEFCKRWFNYAGIMEFLEDWKEYNEKFVQSYSQFGLYGLYNYRNEKLLISPVYDMRGIKVNPFISNDKNFNPIVFFKPLKDNTNKEEKQ